MSAPPIPEGQSQIERMPTMNTLRRLPGFTRRLTPTPEGQPRIEPAPGKIALRRRLAATPSPLVEPRDPLLSIAGAPGQGDARARLALVEFTDYQ